MRHRLRFSRRQPFRGKWDSGVVESLWWKPSVWLGLMRLRWFGVLTALTYLAFKEVGETPFQKNKSRQDTNERTRFCPYMDVQTIPLPVDPCLDVRIKQEVKFKSLFIFLLLQPVRCLNCYIFFLSGCCKFKGITVSISQLQTKMIKSKQAWEVILYITQREVREWVRQCCCLVLNAN